MLILLLTQSLANSCLPFACQSDSFWCLGTNATHVRTNNCKESPYINCPVEQIGDIYQNVTCKLPE